MHSRADGDMHAGRVLRYFEDYVSLSIPYGKLLSLQIYADSSLVKVSVPKRTPVQRLSTR